MINIATYRFPEVSAVDSAFPTFATLPGLLEEAKLRGFYNGGTKWNKKFNALFYEDGSVKLKEGVNNQAAWNYCRALMGSFAPKHEEKEAVCALIMSEILEED